MHVTLLLVEWQGPKGGSCAAPPRWLCRWRSNRRGGHPPNGSGLPNVGGEDETVGRFAPSPDLQPTVALASVENRTHRRVQGCRPASGRNCAWERCDRDGILLLGRVARVHSTRTGSRRVVAPGGAVGREYPSQPLCLFLDPSSPQPQEREQLSQIDEAFGFFALRGG